MIDVLERLKKMPEICATRSPTTGEPITIRRGVIGYYPAHPKLDVYRFNSKRGIEPWQIEAMEIGSCFGREVPGADPDLIYAEHMKRIVCG